MPAAGKLSGSDLVDLPRLLLPDDELDWLALVGAVGVMIDEIGIRDTGGAVALVSSVSDGWIIVGSRDSEAEPGATAGRPPNPPAGSALAAELDSPVAP